LLSSLFRISNRLQLKRATDHCKDDLFIRGELGRKQLIARKEHWPADESLAIFAVP
jgi:hypothetical protein